MQVTRRTLSSSPSLCSARSRTRSRANCSFPSNLSASFLNASLMSSCVGTGGDGVCIRGGALTLASALHLSLLPLSLSSFLRSHRSPLPLSLQLLRMSPLQANRSRANEATGTMHPNNAAPRSQAAVVYLQLCQQPSSPAALLLQGFCNGLTTDLSLSLQPGQGSVAGGSHKCVAMARASPTSRAS